ncbi:DNA mismatch repair protein Mlh3-like isoform X2 [Leptopilina heterotoma]|uniref:DNA mismatch repair protein Mlh3-like isoform X2 n=1 Tax=Leptopilina heterotoma TaxID=63436 RepID=UPI001CA802B1|nr:DNA mismatch repair protein Mlh3-like isoform X2 [Leptopilina heterotoma]
MEISTVGQCVLELILNALDAKTTGIAVRFDSDKKKIQVIDSGEGIPPDVLMRIGEIEKKNGSARVTCYTHSKRGESLRQIIDLSEICLITSKHVHSPTYEKEFRIGESPTFLKTNWLTKGTVVTIYGFDGSGWDSALNRIYFVITSLALLYTDVSFTLQDQKNDKLIVAINKPHEPYSILNFICRQTIPLKTSWHLSSEKSFGFKICGYIGFLETKSSLVRNIFINRRSANCLQMQKLILETVKELSDDELKISIENLYFVIFIQCSESDFILSSYEGRTFVIFEEWRKFADIVKNCILDTVRINSDKFTEPGRSSFQENSKPYESYKKKEISLEKANNFITQRSDQENCSKVSNQLFEEKMISIATQTSARKFDLKKNLKTKKSEIKSKHNIKKTEPFSKKGVNFETNEKKKKAILKLIKDSQETSENPLKTKLKKSQNLKKSSNDIFNRQVDEKPFSKKGGNFETNGKKRKKLLKLIDSQETCENPLKTKLKKFPSQIMKRSLNDIFNRQVSKSSTLNKPIIAKNARLKENVKETKKILAERKLKSKKNVILQKNEKNSFRKPFGSHKITMTQLSFLKKNRRDKLREQRQKREEEKQNALKRKQEETNFEINPEIRPKKIKLNNESQRINHEIIEQFLKSQTREMDEEEEFQQDHEQIFPKNRHKALFSNLFPDEKFVNKIQNQTQDDVDRKKVKIVQDIKINPEDEFMKRLKIIREERKRDQQLQKKENFDSQLKFISHDEFKKLKIDESKNNKSNIWLKRKEENNVIYPEEKVFHVDKLKELNDYQTLIKRMRRNRQYLDETIDQRRGIFKKSKSDELTNKLEKRVQLKNREKNQIHDVETNQRWQKEFNSMENFNREKDDSMFLRPKETDQRCQKKFNSMENIIKEKDSILLRQKDLNFHPKNQGIKIFNEDNRFSQREEISEIAKTRHNDEKSVVSNQDTVHQFVTEHCSQLSEWSDWNYVVPVSKDSIQISESKKVDYHRLYYFLPPIFNSMLPFGKFHILSKTNIQNIDGENIPTIFKPQLKADQIVSRYQNLNVRLCLVSRPNEFKLNRKTLYSIEILRQINSEFIAAIGIQDNSRLLLMIDQHAADERIRYEDLLQNYRIDRTKQYYSIVLDHPILITDMEPEKIKLLITNRNLLGKFGVQLISNSVDLLMVTNVPRCFLRRKSEYSEFKLFCSVKNLLLEIAESLESTNGVSILPKSIHNSIASEACRGAIKFGDFLTNNQCNLLIKSLRKAKAPNRCAHGRPAIFPLLDVTDLKKKQKKSFQKKLNFASLKKKRKI